MTDREIINMLIDAWEALPGGQRYKSWQIEDWLHDHMTPAINKAREEIGRVKPEGAQMTTVTYNQRVRDAITILDSHWPHTQPKLSDVLREIVGEIMVAYAIQCELAILNERGDTAKPE
jgi:hypothetical protein